MNVESSKYINLRHSKISLSFGNFYFFEKFIISEVNEGVHFTWEQGMQILDLAHKHYGEDGRVAYISNRLYSYSVHAQDWLRFFKKYNNIDALAIVTYSEIGFMNIVLEKIFSRVPIKKFQHLEEAIDWVMQPKKAEKVK